MTVESTDPAAVVQAQLDAYNAHDVDALAAIYADEVQHFQHPAILLASGTAEIRARFTARFATARPRAVLKQRFVVGNHVIDHETVHGLYPEGPGSVDLTAIYEVLDGRIARAWFLSGPVTLATA